MTKCDGKTEVYSRVCGFMRPVQVWNKGKVAEFHDRKEYRIEDISADYSEQAINICDRE